MSDTRGLLDRISAFRERLDATPLPVPTPPPLPADAGSAINGEFEDDAFRQTLQQIAGKPEMSERPRPHLTHGAQAMLAHAKNLLDRQRAFTSDALFTGLSAAGEAGSLVAYQRETVACLETIVRLAQGFPESPSAQLKSCDGLACLVGVLEERLAIQERTLLQYRTDIERIDRLAEFFTALHNNQPATLQTVAALAEELLEEVRQAKPLRFLHVPVRSTHAHVGAAAFPVPARFVAAHAINVAQVVARLVPYDYEWAGRQIAPVVAALLMDCGMLAVTPEVLTKPESLSLDERRLIETHAKYGAEVLLWRFPNMAGPLAAAITTHHECCDGTGYPNGLSGAHIPPLGRMLRVADVYAALREDQPHRPAMDSHDALKEVLQLAEQGQLDRDFAEFLLHLAFYPVNTVIEMSDGRVGVVVANHPNLIDPGSSARSVIAVLAAADGTLLSRAEHLDLANTGSGSIARGVPRERVRKLLGSRYPDLI